MEEASALKDISGTKASTRFALHEGMRFTCSSQCNTFEITRLNVDASAINPKFAYVLEGFSVELEKEIVLRALGSLLGPVDRL